MAAVKKKNSSKGKPVRKMGTRAKEARAFAADINSTLKLGGTAAIVMGDDPYFKINRIPTGSLTIDRITGGGWALGRHYELFGDENAGKSTIAYMTMALSQARGKLCAVIDPEHSFDSERFEFLGGDPSELLMFYPQNSEDAITVMMMLAKHARVRQLEVVLIDSVSSLVTTEEMDKDPREKDQPAPQARMMSRALRRITAVNEKTIFLWTNQERTDIGIKFGNPRVTSGGRALRYYATGRLEFRLGEREKEKRQRPRPGKMVESDTEIGRWIQVKSAKEKSTRPNREGAFLFNHETSRIAVSSEIIMLGMEDKLIQRSGNGQYSYTDLDDKEWKGGYKKFAKWIDENDDLQAELMVVISDKSRGSDG